MREELLWKLRSGRGPRMVSLATQRRHVLSVEVMRYSQHGVDGGVKKSRLSMASAARKEETACTSMRTRTVSYLLSSVKEPQTVLRNLMRTAMSNVSHARRGDTATVVLLWYSYYPPSRLLFVTQHIELNSCPDGPKKS